MATVNLSAVITPSNVLTDSNTVSGITNKSFTSPTFVTPTLGTPASGNLANCTGIPAPSAATATALGTVYAKQTTSGGSPYLTAFGYNAGVVNTGVDNTFVGVSAGLVNTSGTDNVAVGYQSLKANISGNSNTAVGVSALVVHTGTFGTAVGFEALKANSTGSQNTAMGYQSMLTNTSADQNTAYGSQSLKLNSTGTANVAVGYSALAASTASSNTAVGYNALTAMTLGNQSTAVGSGAFSSFNRTGDNTPAGVAVGYNAGSAQTTGSNNLCIGISAGASHTTGGVSAYIGHNTTASSGSVEDEIVISSGRGTVTGKGANTTFINCNTGGSYQGNNSASWSVTSDQRLKKNIVDNNDGLDEIAAIQIRNFEYRVEEEITELPAHAVIKKEGVQLGVIAQELQAVLPDCVKEESTGVLSVHSDNLTWYMINAIKQLKAEFDAYKATHP